MSDVTVGIREVGYKGTQRVNVIFFQERFTNWRKLTCHITSVLLFSLRSRSRTKTPPRPAAERERSPHTPPFPPPTRGGPTTPTTTPPPDEDQQAAEEETPSVIGTIPVIGRTVETPYYDLNVNGAHYAEWHGELNGSDAVVDEYGGYGEHVQHQGWGHHHQSVVPTVVAIPTVENCDLELREVPVSDVNLFPCFKGGYYRINSIMILYIYSIFNYL